MLLQIEFIATFRGIARERYEIWGQQSTMQRGSNTTTTEAPAPLEAEIARRAWMPGHDVVPRTCETRPNARQGPAQSANRIAPAGCPASPFAARCCAAAVRRSCSSCRWRNSSPSCRFCAQDVHNIPFPPAFRRPGPGMAPQLPRKMAEESQISLSRRRRRVGSLLPDVGRPWIVAVASETNWFRRYPPYRRPRSHNFARKRTVATLEIDRPYRPAAHISQIAGRIDSGDRELSNGCLGGV